MPESCSSKRIFEKSLSKFSQVVQKKVIVICVPRKVRKMLRNLLKAVPHNFAHWRHSVAGRGNSACLLMTTANLIYVGTGTQNEHEREILFPILCSCINAAPGFSLTRWRPSPPGQTPSSRVRTSTSPSTWTRRRTSSGALRWKGMET